MCAQLHTSCPWNSLCPCLWRHITIGQLEKEEEGDNVFRLIVNVFCFFPFSRGDKVIWKDTVNKNLFQNYFLNYYLCSHKLQQNNQEDINLHRESFQLRGSQTKSKYAAKVSRHIRDGNKNSGQAFGISAIKIIVSISIYYIIIYYKSIY